jgi:prepilin-type N-terminal cleavage/methylation domain-containing protein
MRPRRQCRNRSLQTRGFTLIEIMMVVAIIGLTLTMGLPAFLRVTQKEGMRKVEYSIVEACTAARRAAIMNNEDAKMIIHPLLGTVEVPGAYPVAQFPTDVSIDILGVNFIQLEHADDAVVTFHPNGTSDEFTIVLHASNGQYEKISLDTVTALPVVENIK